MTYAEKIKSHFPLVSQFQGVPVLCRKKLFGEPRGKCDKDCKVCWNEEMEKGEDK